jgi:hypothetical protein
MAAFKSKQITKNHSDVLRALALKEVKEFTSKTKLDFEEIHLNEYEGATKYTITIPVKNDRETVLLLVFDKTDTNKVSAQLLKVRTDEEKLEISFGGVDGQSFVKGSFNRDFELMKVEAEGSQGVSTQDTKSCLMEVFRSLPWWLQAACEGSCATCFGAIWAACAVCAGCIGGSALQCL